jgi:hypothetical protein
MAENLSFDQVTPNETAVTEARRRTAAGRELIAWFKVAAQRRNRRQRQAELRREAQVNRTRAAAYRNMAQYAINLAAKREISQPQRLTRRRQLSDAWRSMRERLALKT